MVYTGSVGGAGWVSGRVGEVVWVDGRGWVGVRGCVGRWLCGWAE